MYGNNPYQSYPYQTNYGGVPGYAQRGYNSQPQAIPQTQPQMQPQSNMLPQVPQIQEFRHGTEDEIRPMIIYPNCVAYFVDYPKGRMYAKRADASGMSSMEYYALTPINPDGTPIKPQDPLPQVNFDDFVKVDQIKDFGFITMEEHKKVLAELDAIKKALAPKPQVPKGVT